MSVAALFVPNPSRFVYHTGLGIYAYLALAALLIGTFRLPADADPILKEGSRRSWDEREPPSGS
jgi:hypothetical protein